MHLIGMEDSTRNTVCCCIDGLQYVCYNKRYDYLGLLVERRQSCNYFRLELKGFKSFADKTIVKFSPGMTAVIGS